MINKLDVSRINSRQNLDNLKDFNIKNILLQMVDDGAGTHTPPPPTFAAHVYSVGPTSVYPLTHEVNVT